MWMWTRALVVSGCRCISAEAKCQTNDEWLGPLRPSSFVLRRFWLEALMATAEERMKILKMVEEGKVSAEDGAKLLSALKDSRKGAGASAARPMGGAPRWFR